MNDENSFFILFTFIVAMCFRILPLSEPVAIFNPDWFLLVLIYWSLTIPERVGIGCAWFFGILNDILMGRFFGQYALSYSIIIYAVLILHKQLRQFPLMQQSAFVFICLLSSQFLLFLSENLKAQTQLHNTFWLPVFSGTFFWAIIHYFMRRRF